MLFDGEPITTVDANRIVNMGIVLVPGDRGIFPGLTTTENLRMAGWLYDKDPEHVKRATESVLDYFPVLRQRLHTQSGSLSGGEQQMLSLAMAFIAEPRLLIIDELSLGLAPTVIESLLEIVKAIHERGTAVILIEQSVNLALRLTERAVFMEKGQVVFAGPTAELVEHEEHRPRRDARRRPPAGPVGHADLGELATVAAAPPTAEAKAARHRRRRGAGAPGPEAEIVLSTRGLTKRFGGVLAVDDVDLDLRKGEILGLIGPERGGQDDGVRDGLGTAAPATSGTVTMNGTDVSDWPAYKRSSFGLGPLLPGGPAVARPHRAGDDRARRRQAGALAGGPRHRSSACRPSGGRRSGWPRPATRSSSSWGSPSYVDMLGSDLSTGQRRMLELAVIVAQRPTVVLLDEPSAGLSQAETEALAPGAARHEGAPRTAASCSSSTTWASRAPWPTGSSRSTPAPW